MDPIRHLYVHVPFCAHRCGYCDFTTVTGREDRHGAYVDALVRELEARGGGLAERPETVYLGGGTPSRLGADLLGRLLDALPRATAETTVECNPEDVDPALAEALAARGCRVSLGAQTLSAPLLATLERRTVPAQVAAAARGLRAAGVASLSLDLIYGIPGGTEEGLRADLDGLLDLDPDHLSAYELEAKPGTRFAVRHGAELTRQATQLERHMDIVIDRLQSAGFDWYEIASFARAEGHRGIHNRAYWRGRDYLGLGIGAVSTIGDERRRNGPRLQAYLDDPVGAPCELELVPARVRRRERLMLGLRLDEGVPLAEVEDVVDPVGVERLSSLGLLRTDGGTMRLDRRGRMLLHDCVAELLDDDDDAT